MEEEIGTKKIRELLYISQLDFNNSYVKAIKFESMISEFFECIANTIKDNPTISNLKNQIEKVNISIPIDFPLELDPKTYFNKSDEIKIKSIKIHVSTFYGFPDNCIFYLFVEIEDKNSLRINLKDLSLKDKILLIPYMVELVEKITQIAEETNKDLQEFIDLNFNTKD